MRPRFEAPRFKVGDRVIVGRANPPGHVRTPSYLKGKRGTIECDFGAWPNPEQLAYGKPGWPRVTNYWVRFTFDEVWGGGPGTRGTDTIVVEIYEPWLEPDPNPAHTPRR